MTDIIAGKLDVSVNGRKLMLVGSFKIKMDIPKREELVGPDGLHGLKELPRAGGIEGSIRNHRDLDVRAIGNMHDATIVAYAACGKNYLCESSDYTGDCDIDTEEGTIPFACVSKSVTEIKA